jgi:hypothetical protein
VTNIDNNGKKAEQKAKEPKPNKKNKVPIISFI